MRKTNIPIMRTTYLEETIQLGTNKIIFELLPRRAHAWWNPHEL